MINWLALHRSNGLGCGCGNLEKMCPVSTYARSTEDDVDVIEGNAQTRSGALKQREVLTLRNAMMYSRKAIIRTGKAMTHTIYGHDLYRQTHDSHNLRP